MAGFDFSLGFGFDTEGAGEAPVESLILLENGSGILLEDGFSNILTE